MKWISWGRWLVYIQVHFMEGFFLSPSLLLLLGAVNVSDWLTPPVSAQSPGWLGLSPIPFPGTVGVWMLSISACFPWLQVSSWVEFCYETWRWTFCACAEEGGLCLRLCWVCRTHSQREGQKQELKWQWEPQTEVTCVFWSWNTAVNAVTAAGQHHSKICFKLLRSLTFPVCLKDFRRLFNSVEWCWRRMQLVFWSCLLPFAIWIKEYVGHWDARAELAQSWAVCYKRELYLKQPLEADKSWSLLAEERFNFFQWEMKPKGQEERKSCAGACVGTHTNLAVLQGRFMCWAWAGWLI